MHPRRSRQIAGHQARPATDAPPAQNLLGDLAHALAELISALGSDRFYHSLIDTIKTWVPVDYPQVWLYHRAHHPAILYSELPADHRAQQIDHYIAGSYQQDPFYLTAFEHYEPGIYRLTEIAAHRFEQSDYYKNYYARLGASDEVVFMTSIDAQTSLQLCLMRSESSAHFDQRELTFLRAAEPLVISLLERHIALRPPRWQQAPGSGNTAIQHAIKLFGQSLLTSRERDVLGLILQGFSARVAAERLEISAETLRRHRKNIYRKLDINSQSELFSLFLNSLEYLDESGGADPLVIYMNAREKAS